MELYFFLLFVLVTVYASDEYECPGGKLTAEVRKQFVERHNELRAELVKGGLKDHKGSVLPTAGNVYKVGWNCTLEQQAQNWIDQCEWRHSPGSYRPWAGENLYSAYYWGMIPDYMKTIGNAATNDWWSELTQDYEGNPANFPQGLNSAGHWSQVSWAWTTSIGCGIANCTQGSWVVVYVDCQYFPMGNIEGFPIFKTGQKCTSSSDCTTFSGSSCETSSGLCIPPAQPSVNNLLGGMELIF